MPIYTVQGQDGRIYKIEGPAGATAEQLGEVISGGRSSVKKDSNFIGNALAGAVRGAGSIGATLLAPVDAAARAAGIQNSFIGLDDRREAMDQALKAMGADTDSLAYGAGKIGAEIAGTAGVGGALAKGLTFAPKLASAVASGGMLAPGANMATRMAGGALAKGLTFAPKLASAVASGGMLAPGANMATRMAGGAITGGASAALVNPEDAAMGAAIGGALPPVVKGAGIVGRKAAEKVSESILSPDAADARRIAEIAGAKTKDEISAIRAALSTPRPSNIGVDLTVPQILQNPGISQLARSVQNAGDMTLVNRAAQQQQAMKDALSRVAPVANTVQDAAQDAGTMIGDFARRAKTSADKATSNLFQSVDPFNETRFYLPLSDLQSARAHYLGRGTYGMGDKAAMAVKVAEDIGTEVVPGFKPEKLVKEETLLQAVKRAGGINPNSLTSSGLSGEIRDLKQMGLGRVINGKTGRSIEKLAESMHERGFIPDNDPATLLDALRAGGDDVAMGGGESAFARMRDSAMGDMPTADRVVMKPVTFRELQNFRASLNSDIEKLAAKPGNQSELAALTRMKKSLDSAVDNVAAGNGAPEEYFPPDIVATWREALASKTNDAKRFLTGPQSRIFARGGDGQAAAQGAEIPRLFFNSLRSQSDDMAGLQRLIGDDKSIQDAMKRYATTSAAGSADALGNLSNAKFQNWLQGHSGAIPKLFSQGEQATLNEIGAQLSRMDAADRLGMAKGSNTMQNINSALSAGLFENPLVNMLTNRLPVLKSTVGPVLEGAKQSAKTAKAQKLAGLLSDPETLDAALADLLALKSRQFLGMSDANRGLLSSAAAKAAPVLIAQ